MSYILDALQKSQRNRELGKVPTLTSDHLPLQDPPPSPEFNPLVMGSLILALLAVALAVYTLMRQPSAPPPAVVSTPLPGTQTTITTTADLSDAPGSFGPAAANPPARTLPPAASPPVVASPQATPAASPPVVATPQASPNKEADAGAASKDAIQKEKTPQPIPKVASAKRPENEPESTLRIDLAAYRQEMLDLLAEEKRREALRRRKTASPAPSGKTPESGEKVSSPSQQYYPLQNQLPADLAQRIPKQRILVHVYTEHPAGRYVIMNSTRLREGDRSPEGLKVIEIRREGLVLAFEGTRFYSPR